MESLDVYSYVCYICGLTTLILNSMLFIVIRHKTIGPMKLYSTALQHGVIIDTICSVVQMLFQVEYQFVDGFIIAGSRTPFNILKGKANCIHPILYFTSVGMSYSAITTLATYRYKLICLQKQLSNRYMIISYLMKFLFSMAIMAWLFVDLQPIHADPTLMAKFRKIAVWRGRDKTDHLCGISDKATGIWVYMICLTLISVINITIMLFTSIKVMLWLREMSTKVQKSMLEVQKQLNFRLFVQCFTPISVSLGAIGSAVVVFAKFNGTAFVIYYVSMLAVVPVINSLATMLCVKCYRKVFFSVIQNRRFSLSYRSTPISGQMYRNSNNIVIK